MFKTALWQALWQSDCRILESTISQVKTDELTWFQACRFKFKKPKRWFENFCIGVIKNVYDQSKLEILKLAMSQEKQG